MLVIRFLRTGKKNQPFFKIVVTDKKNPPRGGRFKEKLGFYNPLTKDKAVNKERVEYWISKGAQVSDTVHNLLVREGILKQAKLPKHKKSKKKEEKPAETPAPKEAETAKKEEKPKEEKPKETPK
jgi:small subunit ribosomal protein S16